MPHPATDCDGWTLVPVPWQSGDWPVGRSHRQVLFALVHL